MVSLPRAKKLIKIARDAISAYFENKELEVSKEKLISSGLDRRGDTVHQNLSGKYLDRKTARI